MKNSSLEKATELIFNAIDKSDINIMDKTEILLNIRQFLDKENYRNNVKILRGSVIKWKKN